MNDTESGINVPKHPSEHLATKIDSYQAAIIARKFFEQYHSGVEVKDMALKDGTWHIIVGVDFLFEKIKIIEIDSNTGRIIRYQ
jgi:hypothetical protein